MRVGGIYEILNTANGKRYIGSAVDLLERWAGHKRRLVRNKHHSVPLQRAWNKYGAQVFVFSPVRLCERENLLLHEQEYLDAFKPEYNVALNATAPMLGRTMSAETRAKMSAAGKGRPGRVWTQEQRDAASLARMGRPVLPATREKLSASLKQTAHMIGRKHSPEMRAKLSAARTGKKYGPRDPAIGAKISAAKMGHTVSAETRAKLSATAKRKKLELVGLAP